MIPKYCKHLIIGGGIIGTSTAYHLSKKCKDEREAYEEAKRKREAEEREKKRQKELELARIEAEKEMKIAESKAKEKEAEARIAEAQAGKRIGDISWAIQSFVESEGYSVVRQYVGHGIGKNLHEEPQIPNFGQPGTGPLLRKGMVIAIEPMVNIGGWETEVLNDNWTVVTADGSLSAHFENTLAITDGEAEVLTL